MHVICYPFKLICSVGSDGGAFLLDLLLPDIYRCRDISYRKMFRVSLIDLQNSLLKTDLMETRDEIYVTAKNFANSLDAVERYCRLALY